MAASGSADPAPASSIWVSAAPASTRGGIQVATYNIGARTDKHYMSAVKKPAFTAKLEADLKALMDCDIIGLQEVSPVWCETVEEMLPPSWSFRYHADGCVVTMWNNDKLHLVAYGTAPLFPGSTSKFRDWRRCLVTTLTTREGVVISVVNNHTIDGQGNRKLQSEKMAVDGLRGAVEAAQEWRNQLPVIPNLTLATTQGRAFVAMGDFNVHSKSAAVKALRLMPQGVDCLYCEGTKNDFVISNVPLTPLLPGPEAKDKKHRALRAQVEAELQGVRTAQSLPPASGVWAPGATRGTVPEAASGVSAPGATRGTVPEAATGSDASDLVRERATNRAAEILKTLYEHMAEVNQRQQEEEERSEVNVQVEAAVKEEPQSSSEESKRSRSPPPAARRRREGDDVSSPSGLTSGDEAGS